MYCVPGTLKLIIPLSLALFLMTPSSLVYSATLDAKTTSLTSEPSDISTLSRNARKGDAAALFILQEKAEKGDAQALTEISNIHELPSYLKQQLVLATKNKYRESAEQGDADAQARLGEIYLWMGNAFPNSSGAMEDYSEALRWFRKSANQRNKWAQLDIGGIYANGLGVPKDETKALDIFLKLANQNYTSAQIRLSDFYLKKNPPDYTEAYYWSSLVEAHKCNGDLCSDWGQEGKIAEIKRHLSPKQKSAIDKRVQEWKPGP